MDFVKPEMAETAETAERGGDGGNGGNGSYGMAKNTHVLSGEHPDYAELNFALDKQSLILYNGGQCTNTLQSLMGPDNVWNFGSDADPSFTNGSEVTVVYTDTGRKTVINGTEEYTDFIIISLDETFIASIHTNAQPSTDSGIYYTCVNDSVSLIAENKGSGYVWDITTVSGPDISPDEYSGFEYEQIDLLFSETGHYIIKHKAKNDCCGWSDTVNIEIIVNEAPIFDMPPTATLCKQTDVTTLTVNNITDSNPSLYHWSPVTGLSNYIHTDNSSSVDVSNISSDITYTFTATNPDGNCQHSETVTVEVENDWIVVPDITNVVCGKDGSIILNTSHITGGSGSFSFNWLTPPLGSVTELTDLEAGVYTVEITDNLKGCSIKKNISVNWGNSALVVLSKKFTANCSGENNSGTALIEWLNGTGDYTLTWNTGSATVAAGENQYLISNLPNGIYEVSLTDNNSGCTVTTGFEIQGSPPLDISIQNGYPFMNSACGLNDGQMEVIVTGGTPGNPPYYYSWSHNPSLNLPVAYDLGPGSHTLIVKDILGCTDAIGFDIFDPIPDMPVVDTPYVLCVGDNLPVITGQGEANANYTWYQTNPYESNPVIMDDGVQTLLNTNINYTSYVDNSTAGQYPLWLIQSSNNCQSEAFYFEIIVSETPQSPIVPAPIKICQGASLPDLIVSPDNNATLTWFDDNPLINNNANIILENSDTLFAGNSSYQNLVDTNISGTYSVWLNQKIGSCESGYSEMLIEVISQPGLIPLDSLLICEGTSIELNDYYQTNGNDTYTWFEGLPYEGNNLTVQNNTLLIPQNDINTYWVLYEITNGCSDSTDLKVYVETQVSAGTVINDISAICNDEELSISLFDMINDYDLNGEWMETSTINSGTFVDNPPSFNPFNLPAGIYTFQYKVNGKNRMSFRQSND